MVSTQGSSENVASYIRVGSNGEESCVCVLARDTATRLECNFYRTDCPIIQNFTINP